MNDVHRTFSSHDGEFSGGPGHIVITLQVLTGHGEVGAAVGLGDEGQLGDGGLCVSKEEFCAMANDTTPRNPGTSSKVSSGMLKASQVRMNLAALMEASISRQPASTLG